MTDIPEDVRQECKDAVERLNKPDFWREAAKKLLDDAVRDALAAIRAMKG